MLCTRTLLVILTILGITTAGPVRYRGARLQLRHAPPSSNSVPSDPIILSTSTVILTLTESAAQSSQPQTSSLLGEGASDSSTSLPGSSTILSSRGTGPSQTATTGNKDTDGSGTVPISASVFSETQGAITFLKDGKPVGTRTATTFAVTSFDTAGPTATGDSRSQGGTLPNARYPSFDMVSASRLTTEPITPSTPITMTLPTTKVPGKQKGSVPAIGNGPGSEEPTFSTVARDPTSSVFQSPRQSSMSRTYIMVSFTAIPSILPGQIASVSRYTAIGATPSEASEATSTSSADEDMAAASSDVGVSTAALTVQPLPNPSSSSDTNIQPSSQSTQASSTFGGTSSLNTLSSTTLASQTSTAAVGQSSTFQADMSPTLPVLSSAVPVRNPGLQTSAIGSSAPGEASAISSTILNSATFSSGLANLGTTSSLAVASNSGIPIASAYPLPDVTITLPGTGPRLQAGGGGFSSGLQEVPTTHATVPVATALSSIPLIAPSSPSQPLPSPSSFVTITTSTAEAGTGVSPSSSTLTSASSQRSTAIQPSQFPPASMTTVTAPSEKPAKGPQRTVVSSSDGPSITVVPVAPDPPSDQKETVTVTTTTTAVLTGSAG